MSSRILAGRYELLERIGDGGMAVVYKARCRLLNRFVAIKILKPEFTKDLKFIENFRRESQSAASLSHPNIVNIYDVGREGNIHYIVMELIEGQVLSDVIKAEGPMDWRRAVEITKQMASALSFAHKNHIIHRDVKPHNILIAADGTAKITDFGIAKAINSSTLVEATGTIMGSVHYFSPEQARGGYVDEKSDIYSLGIVMYEMLTGRVPFDGDNPVAVALMHINDEIIPPSRLVDGIPPGLEQVVMKATNKFQVGRYASADEMLEALNNITFVTNIVGNSVFAASKPIRAQGEEKGEEQEEMRSQEGAASKGKKGKKGKSGKNGGKKIRINKVKLAAVIVALICAIPASNLIVTAISGIGESREVVVPDFAGLTYEQAQTAADEAKLKIEEGDTVFSSDYEEGEIVSQTPEADTKIKTGRTISVNISKGSKEGTVPIIVGKSYEDALLYLKKYGYNQGSVTTAKSDMPKDIVVSQNPGAGEEVKAGARVSFVVSEGKDETQGVMPNVLGINVDEAKLALEKAGLNIGTVLPEISDSYTKNTVMWQQYEEGASLAEGTTVNLKVSNGNEPVGPRSVAIEVSYDQAEKLVFYLTVIVTDDEGTRKVISGEQRIKDDGSEVLSITGTGAKGTVTVIFDVTEVMKKTVNFNTGEVS